MTKPTWNLDKAIELCRKIEVIAPRFGAHVALTGGCLYKDGERKDVDILIYRIRQEPHISIDGFFDALDLILGVKRTADYGWCHKANYQGMDIDFFFPEQDGSGSSYDEVES